MEEVSKSAMSFTRRREFLCQATAGMAAALGVDSWAAAATPGGEQTRRGSDVITLGKTGIKTSRLAIGTGSNGAEQRELGVDGLAKLLHYGLDRGISWWETADLYKTHPHVRAALAGVERSRVVITSKTAAKDAAGARADIERFRRELDTDYIDILLLHCMSEPDWPRVAAGAMEVLDDAKSKGHVRAVGCSLHINDPKYIPSLTPLQAAVDCGWGDVFLVRVNPFAVDTDVKRTEDIPRVEKVFGELHDRGKALYGMKLLGGANPHEHKSRIQVGQIDESLRFALTRPYLCGFTVGVSRQRDLDDLLERIEKAAVPKENAARSAGGT